MEGDKQIVFYDIASGPPRTCYAPNPWKTRYALNFKGVDYRTAWVEYPEVTRTRMELGVPPCRYHADGSPFYTLPVLRDPSTGALVGDTFDIAVYLDKQYPDRPTLIPPRSIAVFKAFNKQMDALFTSTVLLWCQGIPLNPETAEESKAEFVRRTNGTPYEEITVKGEARRQLLEQSKEKLAELAELFQHPEEPFMEGATATYADFIIGGWLTTMSITLPEGDWTEIKSWHDGRWARLYAGLRRYADVK
ncbi:hypothetical protein PFICI_00758 [Pestalotiopsis fici W106-1]|uniref:Uncharacterized protein n=1 Tax=Pestalotiopsis fici (strain W106-1 / CGMCC3.15140) TaxID=1229662 RepID=W3XLS8_PESFW|nr:uncharacterized protein PFICI_00758 [Pestalotiopsis fici W106-1]ETS86930.1 hypothetical protein PFICI_00758 [Pestalotiopsis fici W106-1]